MLGKGGQIIDPLLSQVVIHHEINGYNYYHCVIKYISFHTIRGVKRKIFLSLPSKFGATNIILHGGNFGFASKFCLTP